MPSLMLTDNDGESRQVLLHGTETRIGRSDANHLVIDSRRVSRLHALLVRHGHFVTVRDLASTNGTLVNGARIVACPLLDGDTLQIGDVELRFVDDDAVGADVDPPPLLTMAGASDDASARPIDGVADRWEESTTTERITLETKKRGAPTAGDDAVGGTRGVGWIGDAVSFTFAAQGRPVAALITYEALADHFGTRVYAADAEQQAVEAYRQNHLAINVAASLRYADMPQEPVLLRTVHF